MGILIFIFTHISKKRPFDLRARNALHMLLALLGCGFLTLLMSKALSTSKGQETKGVDGVD